MQLRPYQETMIADTQTAIRKGIKKILLVAPTGSGKTFLAAHLIKDFIADGKKVMFIVHRDILVSQTASELKALGVSCGFIKAGFQEARNSLVQVASLQTLPRREWWKEENHKPDVIFFDESHISCFAKTSKNLLEEYCPDSIVIGLTGTPYRLSKKDKFGDIFEKMISAPTPKELIEAGYLVSPIYYSLGKPNLKNVRIHAGDYSEESLRVEVDKPEILDKVVSEWKSKAYGKRTIVFAVNVAHAENITDAFRRSNISCVTVTGKTPIHERTVYYKAIAEGRLSVIVSCNALSEGFNVKAIECAILLRPTKSKALYFQQLGRALRISPETGKTSAIILDYGNVPTHGFVESINGYRLERTGSEPLEENPVPLKECPNCGAFNYGFALTCSQCSHTFELKEQKFLEDVTLIQVFASKDEERKYNFYRELLREAYNSDYKPGWAQTKYKTAHYKYPKFEWGRAAIKGDNPSLEDYEDYLQYLIRVKSDKEMGWIKKNLLFEFGGGFKEVFKDMPLYRELEQSFEQAAKEVPTVVSVDWKAILAGIPVASSKALFSQQGKAIGLEGNVLKVKAKSQTFLELMQRKSNDLETAAKSVLGTVTIEIF